MNVGRGTSRVRPTFRPVREAHALCIALYHEQLPLPADELRPDHAPLIRAARGEGHHRSAGVGLPRPAASERGDTTGFSLGPVSAGRTAAGSNGTPAASAEATAHPAGPGGVRPADTPLTSRRPA